MLFSERTLESRRSWIRIRPEPLNFSVHGRTYHVLEDQLFSEDGQIGNTSKSSGELFVDHVSLVCLYRDSLRHCSRWLNSPAGGAAD